MAPSKKADRNTTSKSKGVGKAITRPSSTNRPRHNGRYVAATSSLRNTGSDPIEEISPTVLQRIRAVEDQIAELERDERPHKHRVYKSYTRRHRRHHYSSGSNSDSQGGDGRTESSRVSKAETRGHHAAELGSDPPYSWYSQIELPRETARIYWWGLDAKTQKTYAALDKSYVIDCAIKGIKHAFPVTVYSLASWISELSRKRINSAKIKAHLKRVRSLNVDLGYGGSAFDSPLLDRIITGYCRLRGIS